MGEIMTYPRRVLGWAFLGALLLVIVVLSSMLLAEHMYDRAAADCARSGAVPAATETLAYVCVPKR